MCKKIKPDNNNKVWELEDEIDHLKQKSLKGKLIITSKIPQGEGCIKTDTQIKQEGGTLANHVKNLAKFKYNIDITEDDIASCFHLPKGGILAEMVRLSLPEVGQGHQVAHELPHPPLLQLHADQEEKQALVQHQTAEAE